MPELRRVVRRLKPVECSRDIASAPGSGEERGPIKTKAKLKIRVKPCLDLNIGINGEEGFKLGGNKEKGLKLGGIKEEGFDQNIGKMEGKKKLSGEDESGSAPLPQRVQVSTSPVYKLDKKIR